jgi:outer membrane protein OmpA-like peptidoglycan-associated protein
MPTTLVRGVLVSALAWLGLFLPVLAANAASAPPIPLVEGLTVVTAIADKRGDYETLKQVVAVDDANVTLAYRADVPGGNAIEALRPVSRDDLAAADTYRNFFSSGDQKAFPGTTALGPSNAVMAALEDAGEAEFATYVGLGGAYRGHRGTLVKTGTTTLPVLVNGVRHELPVVQAEADFERAKAEFWFYPHPQQPLTLRYRFMEKEAEQFKNLPPEMLKKLREQQPLREESMRVVKIEYPGGETGEATEEPLEAQLETEGRAEVYGIYFDFDSDRLKPESDAVLERIAGILSRNQNWTLSIEGHTDNVGTDDYNLELSRRRAASVKTALVDRYGIAELRLETDGHGASQPKASNDTLEGRAMNRRVELVRD